MCCCGELLHGICYAKLCIGIAVVANDQASREREQQSIYPTCKESELSYCRLTRTVST